MVIVVGGHSRNIGKTSVICGIIRTLPDWNWTALKITPHPHGRSDPAHPVAVSAVSAVSEETGAAPSTDSGRFLAAGAVRAFLLQSASGELYAAMGVVRRAIAERENVIIESNSILRFLQPDVCAMVLDGSVADFKPSSLEFLDRADFLV